MRNLLWEEARVKDRKRNLSTLRDQAYLQIKDALLQSDGSGDNFSERQLAADLGLSLGPVRAAIERLRAENLIVVSRNTGIQLPQLTPDAILDFFEVRLALETLVVEALAGQEISERCDYVEDILENQLECVEQGRADAYHDLDMQFHLGMATLHGNAEIVRVLGGLRDRMYRLSSRMHAGHPERLEENYSQHKAIFEAVRAGDGVAARTNLVAHLSNGKNFLMNPRHQTRRSASLTAA